MGKRGGEVSNQNEERLRKNKKKKKSKKQAEQSVIALEKTEVESVEEVDFNTKDNASKLNDVEKVPADDSLLECANGHVSNRDAKKKKKKRKCNSEVVLSDRDVSTNQEVMNTENVDIGQAEYSKIRKKKKKKKGDSPCDKTSRKINGKSGDVHQNTVIVLETNCHGEENEENNSKEKYKKKKKKKKKKNFLAPISSEQATHESAVMNKCIRTSEENQVGCRKLSECSESGYEYLAGPDGKPGLNEVSPKRQKKRKKKKKECVEDGNKKNFDSKYIKESNENDQDLESITETKVFDGKRKKRSREEDASEKEDVNDDSGNLVTEDHSHEQPVKKKKKKSKNKAKAGDKQVEVDKSQSQNLYEEKVEARESQWGNAEFDSSAQKEKFLRLMGAYKSSTKPKTASSYSVLAMNREQEKALSCSLEKQFHLAMQTRKEKGVGLGFQ